MNTELPEYLCHKKVRAAKIVDMAAKNSRPSWQTLRLETPDHVVLVEVDVTDGWVKAKGAHVGGYFVQYEDGYQSFSPAQAFENGYTLVTTDQPANEATSSTPRVQA